MTRQQDARPAHVDANAVWPSRAPYRSRTHAEVPPIVVPLDPADDAASTPPVVETGDVVVSPHVVEPPRVEHERATPAPPARVPTRSKGRRR